MSTGFVRRSRRSLVSGALACGVGVVCAVWFARPAESQSVEPVVRIEEDWLLVLNEPDGNADSPQFHTVMAPFVGYDDYYAQVLWNYRETPGFTPGGVQLQSYYGEHMTRSRSMEFSKLNTTAETIQWTQSLATDGLVLEFQVQNGQSITWGSFGKDMRISSDANLPNLAGYSPDFSAQNSGVTFGSNRVDLMVITQVRKYGPSGLLSVDSTPRIVFELN